jgi:hypothetical protein
MLSFVVRKGYEEIFVQPSRSFPIYEKILLQNEERYPYRLPSMGTFKDLELLRSKIPDGLKVV